MRSSISSDRREVETEAIVAWQILEAYVHALSAVPAPCWVALLLAPLLVWLHWRDEAHPGPRWPGRLLLALLVAAGTVWAWHLRWVGDDAYISFRYARNLVEGNGLVFNLGERVEGYTNFLWTLLIAGGLALGVHPAQGSVLLGLLCFAIVLSTLQRLTALEIAREPAGLRPRWPGLAVPLAAGGYVLASFATSGLETMFAAMLVLLSLEEAERRRPFASGLLGIAATLAHPDHGIFFVALGAALVMGRAPLRALVRYALPFVVVFVPYFLWRWQYYGDLLPNTFYAKSADRAYFGQGGVFLLVNGLAMGLWAMLPLTLVGCLAYRRTLLVRFCAIGIPVYLFYTAKIGGDFMLGRLLVTPALLIIVLAGLGFERLLRERERLQASALGALALTAVLPVALIQPGAKTWFISDERTFYPLTTFAPPYVASRYSKEAATLERQLLAQGLRPKLATDCVGIVGYETDLPLFDLLGLTSREVARTPIGRRKRPGHEKVASPAQILESGAQLSKLPVFPEPYAATTQVRLDDFLYYLTAYTPELGEPLVRAGRARDPRAVLARMAEALPLRSPWARACDVWFAREYYFRHNADPELVDRWADALTPGLARDEATALLLEGRALESLGYGRVGGFDFDGELPDWQREGHAFETSPVHGPVPDQESVGNRSRGFVNSFLPDIGDRAVGRLVSPPFVLAGDLVTLQVGGGDHGVRADLLVDGEPVRSTSGCGSEILRREVWDVRAFRGRTASLQIVDERRDPGGHILVDDFAVWAKRGPDTP